MSLFRDEAPVLADAFIELSNGAGAPTLAKVGVAHIIDVSGVGATATSQSVFVAPPNASAATGFLPLGQYRLAGASLTYSVAGTGNLQVEKTPSGTAPGSGTALLTAGMLLTGTANTTVNGILIANPNTLTLNAGDRLSIVFSATPTGLVNLCVTLYIVRV